MYRNECFYCHLAVFAPIPNSLASSSAIPRTRTSKPARSSPASACKSPPAFADSLPALSEPEARARILDKIAEIYGEEKDYLMAEKALEQALNLTPGDTERRFKLAYMYSEQGQKLLSLFHYQLLVSRDPTYPYAMNNLGVLYGDLNLPGKKIQTWKNATQNKDETFPIGNIAIAMIENGFYDEARNLLDTVPTERKTDKRIAAAIDLLSSKPGKEDAELEGLAGSMEVRHRYMLKAVESEQDGDLSKCTADAFLGLWKTPDGKELDFEVSDKGDLSATMKHPPTQGQVTSVFHRDQYFRQEFNLYIQRSGLVLSGSAVPSNRPPTFSLLSGSPASESFFMVLTGFNTLEGCFWSDDKYLKEVMFDRT